MKKIIALILLLLFFTPALVLAQEDPPGGQNLQGGQNKCTKDVCLENPLGTVTNPAEVIRNVIKAILGLTGVIALVAFVAGGVIWMTSGGNAEKVKKGKDIMVWAVLGLFIIFSSYSILKYVFKAIT